jgi:hypothetical protein
MKLKNTLFLLLVAVAIFAFIALYEKHQPTTLEAREQASRVVQMDRDAVNEISIKNAETKIELRKGENNVWMLNEPVKDRADAMAVNQLFTTAESLKHDAVINDGKGEKDQSKEFGLANSETRVRFAGGEKPVELLLGKDAAVEGKIYVKRADEKAVYVIPNELKNQLTKKADEFRDPKLTDLAATQVNRVIVKTGAGEIELQKKDDQWSVVKPLQARGDASKVGDLISKRRTRAWSRSSQTPRMPQPLDCRNHVAPSRFLRMVARSRRCCRSVQSPKRRKTKIRSMRGFLPVTPS